MKKIVFALIFFLNGLFLTANQNTLLRTINQDSDFIVADNLGQIYAIKGEELTKFDSQGSFLQRYSNKRLGKISSVDVTNPLKILLFYKDFSVLIFLDDMLAQASEPINLANYSAEQASLTCSSHNNGIWFYDPISFQLTRIGQNAQIINQTGNIAQQLNIEIKPVFLVEYNNWVYLNNPQTGILVFDIFGTYYKTIPLQNIKGFQFQNNSLIYADKNTLSRFNLVSLEQSTLVIPDQEIINLVVSGKFIFAQKKGRVEIHAF